jgi:hypothetical protein
MGIVDWIGIVFVAIGLSGVWIGRHLFGLMWFWGGVAFVFLGCALVLNEVRRRRLESNLRNYNGPGDYGDTHYHSGYSAGDGIDSGGGANWG